jgi:hypothetical protein
MVVDRQTSTSNPAGSPTVHAERHREERATQRASRGPEAPASGRKNSKDPSDRAATKRPQRSPSERD